MQQHIRVLAGITIVSTLITCLSASPNLHLQGHSIQKRYESTNSDWHVQDLFDPKAFDYGCKGVYDKRSFDKLNRICDDCYNLFRAPRLHQDCRENCFTSFYFKGCIDALLLNDEEEEIKTMIKQLHGAEPDL